MVKFVTTSKLQVASMRTAAFAFNTPPFSQQGRAEAEGEAEVI